MQSLNTPGRFLFISWRVGTLFQLLLALPSNSVRWLATTVSSCGIGLWCPPHCSEISWLRSYSVGYLFCWNWCSSRPSFIILFLMTIIYYFCCQTKACIAYFCLKGPNQRSAQVLLLLVIPGHLIFIYAIHLLQSGNTSPTLIFISLYLTAAFMQVGLKWLADVESLYCGGV